MMMMVVVAMTFKITFTLITMTGREGADADQGATKVVDNSSEAEDDDIDSKHVDGGGGMMIFYLEAFIKEELCAKALKHW